MSGHAKTGAADAAAQARAAAEAPRRDNRAEKTIIDIDGRKVTVIGHYRYGGILFEIRAEREAENQTYDALNSAVIDALVAADIAFEHIVDKLNAIEAAASYNTKKAVLTAGAIAAIAATETGDDTVRITVTVKEVGGQ